MIQGIIFAIMCCAFGIAFYESKKQGKFPKWFMVFASLMGLLLIVVSVSANRLIDYWWFQSLGSEYTQVFYKKYLVNSLMLVPLAILSFGTMFLAKFTFKALNSYSFESKSFEIKYKLGGIIGALAVLMYIYSLFDWKELMFFFHQVEWGITEQVHGNDIGYYVFTLPLVGTVINIMMVLGLFFTLLLISQKIVLETTRVKRLSDETEDRKDYVIPVAIVSAFIPLSIWLWYKSYELVVSSKNDVVLSGPGYITDTFIIPALPVIAVVFLAALVYIVISATLKGYHKSQLWVGGSAIVSTLVFFAIVTVVSVIKVSPDALTYEVPYIKKNMQMTKWAYGLDQVVKKDVKVINPSSDDLRNNADVMRNVRVHDFQTSMIPMDQNQQRKPFYDMVDLDLDHYEIDGEERLVMLSLRELNFSGLSQKSLVNKWFKYTHGYSFAAFNANEYTAEGFPKYIAKDMPNKTRELSLMTDQPRIYFGEFDDSEQPFVFLKTKMTEFDYPSAVTDAEYQYDAVPHGAIKMNGMKSLFVANQEGALKIFLNDNITKESYFVPHRNIMKRAKRAFPFLVFDYDPLPVIQTDGIYFIMDAYIQSSDIPYANGYMRNSVKVVQNAFTGEMKAYVVPSADDKIIEVWGKIFPGLLKSLSEMPEGLQKHLRYPEELLIAQKEVYKRYHVSDPVHFFDGNNIYSSLNDRGPFFNLTKLPYDGFNHLSMKLLANLNYERRPDLSAVLVGDWNGSLNLAALHVNSETPFRGAQQFQKAIEADEDMKAKLTLWEGSGSLIFGPIIPNIMDNGTEDGISLFYSQPIYMSPGGEGSIPKVTRVAVGDHTRVEWSSSPEEALRKLVSDVYSAAGKSELDTNVDEYVSQNGDDFISKYSKQKQNGDTKGLLQLLNAEEARILESLN